MEKGATGMDLCTKCGGLSREGRALPRNQPFTKFAEPEMRDLRYVVATGTIVTAVMLEDGSTGIAITYRLADGDQLPPIVVAGDQAVTFGRLVAEALRAGQRTAN
jgi:hypothetical protein